MNQKSKIYIAGHNGMVGSSFVDYFKNLKYKNIITATHQELDLTNQMKTDNFFKIEKPDYVILAAARVGGIHANNTYRAEFLYQNLQIQSNVIHSSHKYKVKKLLFLGSACIYPKYSKQPINEEELLNGPLEYTNEPYAIAKIAGIKLCENYYRQYGDDFFSVMPNNLYGPQDNFDLKTSHVLPALIRKFYNAKVNQDEEVEIWGTGKPLREFVHVHDLVSACIFLINNLSAGELYNSGVSHINIGSGYEISIKDLAYLLKDKIGFSGDLKFNLEYSDGTPRKLLDCKRLERMGWKPSIKFEEGVEAVYKWFRENC